MLHSPKATHKSNKIKYDEAPRSENDTTNPDHEVSFQVSSPEDFVTQRVKQRPSDSVPSDFNELKSMLTAMMSNQSARLDKLELLMVNINGQTTNIESTNTVIQKSMTSLSDKMTKIEAQITNLEVNRKAMSAELTAIQEKVISFDRHISKTSIEIRNVPKRSTETKTMLYETIFQLSRSLSLEISRSDIRDVTRGPSKKEQMTSTLNVEFSNTLAKTQCLTMAKEFNKKNQQNKLNSTHLAFPGSAVPIYIDELLTPASKRLFYLTRNFVKQSHYNFCWTSNDKIFLKENKDSAYFQIKSESHLNSLAKSTTE